MQSKINTAEFIELVEREIPGVADYQLTVEQLIAGKAVIRIPYKDMFLRPGGTISGPVQMALADLTMYAVVLSLIGRVELAVTTNLNCNFLRRPGQTDMIAEGKILKLGKRLAVGEVTLYSHGDPAPVAHVTSTYSIPPDHAPVNPFKN